MNFERTRQAAVAAIDWHRQIPQHQLPKPVRVYGTDFYFSRSERPTWWVPGRCKITVGDDGIKSEQWSPREFGHGVGPGGRGESSAQAVSPRNKQLLRVWALCLEAAECWRDAQAGDLHVKEANALQRKAMALEAAAQELCDE